MIEACHSRCHYGGDARAYGYVGAPAARAAAASPASIVGWDQARGDLVALFGKRKEEKQTNEKEKERPERRVGDGWSEDGWRTKLILWS